MPAVVMHAAALAVLLFLLARHEVCFSLLKTTLVVFGVSLICVLLELWRPLAPLAGFAVITPLALKRFFHMRTRIVVAVTIPFMCWLTLTYVPFW